MGRSVAFPSTSFSKAYFAFQEQEATGIPASLEQVNVVLEIECCSIITCLPARKRDINLLQLYLTACVW